LPDDIVISDAPDILWGGPYTPKNLHKTLHTFHFTE
jgi:hypothetical protein